MMPRLRSVKRLLVDLPRQMRLAYCLIGDQRVPRYTKVAFGGALALIALPIVDLPESIPVVGELDVIALSLLAVRLFIAACPRYIVEEQEQLILERRSRFDDDVRKGERIATLLYQRLHHDDEVSLSGAAPHAPGAEAAQRASS